MLSLADAAKDFLAQKRIAVVGALWSSDEPACLVLRKLRKSGHEVFAVDPHTTEVDGTPCYPDLKSIPGGCDAVMITTPPPAAAATVRVCAELGIRWIWLHRGLGQGSFSEEAVGIARDAKLTLIPGACPMMFCAPIDLPHKCFRWVLNVAGRLPKEVERPVA
jgi:uncharacterized protein